jgi:hypothetical protein
MFNDAEAIRTPVTVEQTEVSEVSDGMRIARYSTMDELPGLIFGILTVGYIVLSLTGLAP